MDHSLSKMEPYLSCNGCPIRVAMGAEISQYEHKFGQTKFVSESFD
jgi:hypothetical protein